jgi:polar amino acid transport system substrate-binding protein
MAQPYRKPRSPCPHWFIHGIVAQSFCSHDLDMRTLLIRCILVLACVPAGAPAFADTWTIRADNWCPYNCEPDTPNPGYMVEILQRAARSHGHTLDYKLMPWPRALAQAREGKITGVVSMVASNREGLVMSDKMGVDVNCVFVHKNSKLRYRSPSDLDALGRIGIVEGYGYPQEFMRWKSTHNEKLQALTGDNTLEMQSKKLASGRIDAFIENVNVVRYANTSISELRLATNAGCMSDENLYFGYSAKNPRAKKVKVQIDQELAAMKKSGELRKLLDKYRVTPW